MRIVQGRLSMWMSMRELPQRPLVPVRLLPAPSTLYQLVKEAWE